MAATTRNVDLTEAGEGGSFRPKRKPEGDYLAKIVKADDHTPKKEGSQPGWVLTIQIDGDARSSYPYYLNTAKNQAWKIGGIMRACGLATKNAKIKFDPNKLVNRKLGVALADDEYNGREKSVIDDVFPVSEISPNASEGTVDDEDEYEDDEVEDTSIPEDDEDLADEPEEDEEPEPTPAPRRRRKPAPEPEPEEDDDEEDEEPAPAPKRRRAAPPPAPAKTTRARKTTPPPADDDEDDDLDDIDVDDLD